MTQEGFKRKLTAILSADVVGYSRLMRDDEEATVRDIAAHRILISEIIEQNQGRVIDSPGDNILAEFGSVVDAVNGAIKIQKTIKTQNSDIYDNRRMEFRIGINLGDVIEEGNHIYGDGVNIAARVEGLAAGGGIAISGTVYEHIKSKLSMGYHYLGEQHVKNISEPIRIYRLLTSPEDAGKMIGKKKKGSKLKVVLLIVAVFLVIAGGVLGGLYWKYMYLPAPVAIDSESKVTFNLSQGPSIAVLPFDNMSKDPDQDYFCDGITENIIAVLSHIPQLMVIARNSTFAYKGKPINVQQIGHELGAQYVIEGSIQKSNDRVRITVQLIDTESGHHIWSERYDREFKDIFQLQDEIALEITTAMQIHITEGEMAGTRFQNASDLQDYLKVLKIMKYINHNTKESNNLARIEVEQIRTTHSEYAGTQLLLGLVYAQGIQLGACESDFICIGKATEATRKALVISPNNSDAHALASYLFIVRKEYDKAIVEAKNAIKLNPNNPEAYALLGMGLLYTNRPSEAIVSFKKAIRLDPIPPVWHLFYIGWAYRISGQYEDAIDIFKKCLGRQSDFWPAYTGLALSYYFLGREEEAREAVKEAYKLNPDYSIKMYKKKSPFKNPAEIEDAVEALRKVGVPE